MSDRGFPALARLAGLVVLGAAVLVCTATGRLLFDGRRHMASGDSAREAGKRELAAASYEDAARAYVPGSPYPRRALERLALMAKGAEMRGEGVAAAARWEAVRRSILSTRHFVVPNTDLLENAERELARLRAAGEDGTKGVDPVARPRDPSAILSLVLFAGLAAWICGALVLCVVPASPGRGRSRTHVTGWALSLCGLAAWLAAAWLAG
ncbi:MAG: hypothetical protein PHU25_21600 [Deltaproteobacteria bacterium]|nr:hypothetical protein [Deltaproteobacteria bacterium]